MTIPMPTREELTRFAPRAKPFYIDAVLAGEEDLRRAGVLDHPLTLSHWMAQTAAETGFWTIWEENLKYKSVEGIRQVWPARTRKMSADKLASLVNNPKALAREMYGSRMGNRAGTDDGYTYRGIGFFQTTGRHNYAKYATHLGLSLSPALVEDPSTSLQFACIEWHSSGCNTYAMQNDILSISRAINVGSAKSSVMPNGMEHRRAALKRAWSIWGDPERKHIAEVSGVTRADLKKGGSETLVLTDLVKAGGIAGGVGSMATGAASESGRITTVPVTTTTQTIDQAKESLQSTNESVTLVTEFLGSIKGFWILLSTNLWMMGLILAVLAYWVGRRIDWRRVLNARLGQNLTNLDHLDPVPDDLDLDPDLAVIPRA